ncbi:hypothetical protein RGQ21_67700 [Kitasatospora aureofaciens]|nr:hypothetical protein RGQ21_67700 [Kitasatospora aureofaciens]
MSARDDVLNTMRYALEWGGSEEDNVDELNAYRDAVLREAAEKIRDTYVDYSADVCADLIDPEVEQ